MRTCSRYRDTRSSTWPRQQGPMRACLWGWGWAWGLAWACSRAWAVPLEGCMVPQLGQRQWAVAGSCSQPARLLAAPPRGLAGCLGRTVVLRHLVTCGAAGVANENELSQIDKPDSIYGILRFKS